MGLKKQIGMGITAAALGLTLIGGGTFAYFSDSETNESTFAAGTLDLAAEPTTIVDIDDMKPGDSITRDFILENNGNLDIASVSLDTDYSVNNVKGDNPENFGKHIEVEFLYNVDQLNEVIYATTLYDLQDMDPEVVKEEVFDELMEDGLEAGTEDDMAVKFNFVDNDEDQNKYQGASLDLEWTFNAKQETGEEI
ncbi:MAG TPA: CalY family protein [Virgibacillus sp.]|nr:CalY family protein [Virgibacillus sp.]HLR67911.1 CalY family protein [Virgibacillus sp.]